MSAVPMDKATPEQLALALCATAIRAQAGAQS